MHSDLGRLAAGVALRRRSRRGRVELCDAVPEDSKDYRDLVWLGQMLGRRAQRCGSRAEAAPGCRAGPRRSRAVGGPGAVPRWAEAADEAREAVRQAEAKLPPAKATLALAQCHEVAAARTTRPRQALRAGTGAAGRRRGRGAQRGRRSTCAAAESQGDADCWSGSWRARSRPPPTTSIGRGEAWRSCWPPARTTGASARPWNWSA